MSNNMTTFWAFLKDNPVDIPIIQRDYAQGREGKEFLRNSFLTNLKQALDCALPNGETSLKLDFVYGSMENHRLLPLDGQQRLTTLWLLHWFIALKAGKLHDAQPVLAHFTYETRLSSRHFCHELCQASHFNNYDKKKLVSDYIVRQTWFYRAWMQDPTIQSMLRMIKGTRIANKQGFDIVDGLEELFANTEPQKFVHYWELLISTDAPIIFFQLPLHNFGLSDDLYIKMNARGKQLTSFENLKADLVGYIQQQVKEDESWESLLDANTGLPLKMDTCWTDIFWGQRSVGVVQKTKDGQQQVVKSHKIDDIFFTFFNRFFWNELFVAKTTNLKNTGEYVLSVGKGENTATEEVKNGSYAYLNDSRNSKTYDSKIAYEGFDVYKYYPMGAENGIPKSFFEKLDRVLTHYHNGLEFEEWLRCPWNATFRFIPSYEKQNGYNVEIENNQGEPILKVTPLGQIERIVFFAVCKYLDEGEVNETSLKRWMRVVWNLVSGEGEDGKDEIRSTQAMRTAIEFIDSLNSHDVYSSLRNLSALRGHSTFEARCKEEIVKAQQIGRNPLWEEPIREAENYAFCKGSIRFLYQDANGQPNWSFFEQKWAFFKQVFKQMPKGNESALNEPFDSAALLKRFISWFGAEQYWQTLNHSHKTFNNYPLSWKYFLLNDCLWWPVHRLLMQEPADKRDDSASDEALHRLWQLSQTQLLDFVMQYIPTSWIRHYHGHIAIYPSDTGVFLNAVQRDAFLLHTEGITLYNYGVIPTVVGNHEFLYGSDIDFCYQGSSYRWCRTGTICLLHHHENYASLVVKNAEAEVDNDKYYCVKVASDMDAEAITQLLIDLRNSTLEK